METVGLNRGHAALRRGRVSLPGNAYHLTLVSAGRTPWFLHPEAAVATAACFEDRVLVREAGMLAWVLMPDHAHLLVQLGPDEGLPALVNRLKSASARRANAVLGRQGTLWARAYHDRGLRRDDDVRAVAEYIIANPLRAGMVERIGDYPWWNGIWWSRPRAFRR